MGRKSPLKIEAQRRKRERKKKLVAEAPRHRRSFRSPRLVLEQWERRVREGTLSHPALSSPFIPPMIAALQARLEAQLPLLTTPPDIPIRGEKLAAVLPDLLPPPTRYEGEEGIIEVNSFRSLAAHLNGLFAIEDVVRLLPLQVVLVE